MKVLSLFDWISCGRIALERAGIKVDKYYASEIDKYAIQISQKNYPDIIHIGSVNEIVYEDGAVFHNQDNNPMQNGGSYITDIDILIGWSPCQSFSIAGKQEGFGGKSWLFYEYLRILREVKPKYFLLENVKMKKEWRDEISKEMWCEPIEINSSLVSAPSRKRLYWTNIPWIEQPKDKNIFLKDVLEEEVDEKYNISNQHTEAMLRARSSGKLNIPDEELKCGTIISSYYKIPQDWPYILRWRPKMPYEHWKRELEYIQYNNKCPTISTNPASWDQKNIVSDGIYIRKLTPIECERLQTLPDGYTEWVSNSQRYKAIWNGWTVDVIAHIFSYIK